MDRNTKLVLKTIGITLFILIFTWELTKGIFYTLDLEKDLCQELGFDEYKYTDGFGKTCIKYEDIEKNNGYFSKVKCDHPFFRPWDSDCYLAQMPERFQYHIKYLILKEELKNEYLIKLKEVNKNG